MDTIKNIKLKESHAQRLLRLAYAENEELIVQVKELQALIDDNIALIKQLEDNAFNGINSIPNSFNDLSEAEDTDEDTDEEYDPKWSIGKKVIYIVKESEKPLLAGMIVNNIIEKDPSSYPDEESKRKLSISIYAALNTKYKSGVFSRKGSSNGFRYQIKTEKKEQQ